LEVVGRDHCGSRLGNRSTHVEGLSIRVEDLSMHVLPMHVEGLFPRMLRIFPRVVVLAAWPWHSHTIFWFCRLVCPSCGFPRSQANFRCLFAATSACGFSHFVVLPACGPAALYPPNLRHSQFIGLSSLPPRGLFQPVAYFSSWPLSARGLMWPLMAPQLVASPT
jgi:hypothetical protein